MVRAANSVATTTSCFIAAFYIFEVNECNRDLPPTEKIAYVGGVTSCLPTTRRLAGPVWCVQWKIFCISILLMTSPQETEYFACLLRT